MGKRLARFFGPVQARTVVLLLVALAAGVGFASPPEPEAYELTQEDFTGVATQILTYLGYAVIAGLSVLVAVIAARRGWSFLRRFL